jgi:hypothetical protein
MNNPRQTNILTFIDQWFTGQELGHFKGIDILIWNEGCVFGWAETFGIDWRRLVGLFMIEID